MSGLMHVPVLADYPDLRARTKPRTPAGTSALGTVVAAIGSVGTIATFFAAQLLRQPALAAFVPPATALALAALAAVAISKREPSSIAAAIDDRSAYLYVFGQPTRMVAKVCLPIALALFAIGVGSLPRRVWHPVAVEGYACGPDGLALANVSVEASAASGRAVGRSEAPTDSEGFFHLAVPRLSEAPAELRATSEACRSPMHSPIDKIVDATTGCPEAAVPPGRRHDPHPRAWLLQCP